MANPRITITQSQLDYLSEIDDTAQNAIAVLIDSHKRLSAMFEKLSFAGFQSIPSQYEPQAAKMSQNEPNPATESAPNWDGGNAMEWE